MGTALLLIVLLAMGRALATAADTDRHPLDSLAADAGDDEWLSEADGIIRAQVASTGITATTLRATPSELTFDFSVDPTVTSEGKVAIPLAVPRGEITTGVLLRLDLDGKATSDPAALRQVKTNVRELGYVRTFRVAVLDISHDLGAFGQRRITGGSATIRITPPPPVRDLRALKFWSRNRVGIFRQLVEQLVANRQDIDRYIVVPEQVIPHGIAPVEPPPPEIQTSPFRMKITIDRAGVYRISGADLESSGVVTTWLNPAHVRLFNNGREVPMLFASASSEQSNGVRPDDAFLFYGAETTSPFSAHNVHWLIYDEAHEQKPVDRSAPPPEGVACESAATFLTKTVVEEDRKVLTRSDQFLSILGYRWVWDELPTSGSFTVNFDLPDYQPAGRDLPAVLNLFVHELAPDTSATVCLQINGGAVRRFSIANERDDHKALTLREQEMRGEHNTLRAWLEVAQTSPQAAAAGIKLKAAEIYLDNMEVWHGRPYRVHKLPEEITSPYREDTGTTRAMEYHVAIDAPADRILVFDVTDAEPKLVASTLTTKGAGQRVLEFRAVERGPRRYVITSAASATPATLEPIGTSAVDLWSTATQADYLIVAYPDFAPDMQGFVQRLEAAGHKVLLVDTQTVYDQFSWGQETPEAIKRFVDYAVRYYDGPAGKPPASYLLLVGDATSAYKNEFRNNVINYVPSFTMHTDPTSGEQWASDHWYSRVLGEDDLSDILVGRISVNNRADLRNVLSKLEDYAAQGRSEVDWRSRVGFVADHTEFDAPTRRMAELVPPSYSVSLLSLSEEPWEDNFYFPAEVAESRQAKVSPEMTRKIRDLFNNGAALVWYFGHGSPNVWSTQRIWFGGDSENSDNLMLRNRDRLPVVLNMTCNSGAIDYPMPRWNVCISEDFLRVPNGGAAACYVPSGPGMVSVHEKLSREIVRTWLAQRLEPLGPSLALASWRYLAQGNPENLVRMYVLLGDPSMQTALAPAGGMFVKGLGTAGDLRLAGPVQQSVAPDGSSARVTFQFEAENTSAMPLREAIFSVRNPAWKLESNFYNFMPHEKRQVTLSGSVPAGLWEGRLEARVRKPNQDVPLEGARPLAVVVGGEETSQPLRIAQPTMTVRHLERPRMAQVECDIANVGPAALGPVRVWLEQTSGTVVAESVTSVPRMGSGERTHLTLTRNFESFPDEEQLWLRAASEEAASDATTSCQVTLGRRAMPDLSIPEGGILPHKAPVVEGETVFFQVVVENMGNAEAHNVRVDGYDGITTSAPSLQARVLRPFTTVDIAPHSRAIIPVRWDPFRNAGLHELLFRVWSGSPDAEARTDNNRRVTHLKVLRKYDLKPLGVSIIPQTPEDSEKHQIRVAVRIANRGESAAHGVRVIVYGDRKSANRNDVLGEDMIDEIAAGETVERIVTYRLTSHDVGRRIEPWCEVFLKGSLQRVPWPE
jgi:hypothetical protein